MIPLVTPSVLRRRRLGFAAANMVTYLALIGALWHALGWSWLNLVLAGCFATVAPWNVLGFWNAVIGLTVLFAEEWRSQTLPARALVEGLDVPGQDSPHVPRTAVVMTVRNEDPVRAIVRLRIVRDSLDATGAAADFRYFLLSDTSDPVIAALEAAAMAEPDSDRIQYRRRQTNFGFKAGNIMDFCRHWGDDFELMVTLDADSLMSGPAILHLVGIMRQHPRFGIVQGLVTGLPSASPFARLFQFGMRHGMRSYTAGQAWWTGDCGPFWGHNAIIRVAPFRAHCELPMLPGRPPFGGHILSHDQVEAVLMRRAGWEVRLQPVAGGSWEDNPPTIMEYVRRDLRWCHGNLQYFRLLGLPGLRPVSRFQLVWAILMFVGIPAWTLLIALVPLAAWARPVADASWLVWVYCVFVLMYFSPKLAGYLHTAASRRRRTRYGGWPRFLVGVACETVFSLFQNSITSLHVTGFIAALMVGRSAAWAGQVRDVRTVSWREAMRAFWPQTAFGAVLHGALLFVAPALVPWALPFTLGYLLAIPFAVLTADRSIGAWCVRHDLCAVPEDLYPPPEVVALTNLTVGVGQLAQRQAEEHPRKTLNQ